MNWDLMLAEYNSGLEVLAAVLTLVIFISSLDDLFIDLWYWGRRAFRSLKVQRSPQFRRLAPEQLRDREEQPMAIMVPAWQESDVIAAMVQNMVEVLEYRNYRVFIGTYPNDQPTIDEVEKMARRYPQVQRVEVPHPGPTSKADCLNAVVAAISRALSASDSCRWRNRPASASASPSGGMTIRPRRLSESIFLIAAATFATSAGSVPAFCASRPMLTSISTVASAP